MAFGPQAIICQPLFKGPGNQLLPELGFIQPTIHSCSALSLHQDLEANITQSVPSGCLQCGGPDKQLKKYCQLSAPARGSAGRGTRRQEKGAIPGVSLLSSMMADVTGCLNPRIPICAEPNLHVTGGQWLCPFAPIPCTLSDAWNFRWMEEGQQPHGEALSVR